jgi:hypothetical protein
VIATAAALALAAASAAATKISSNDLWWHLKTGEWIAANGTVPRSDPFSFTSAGTPWVDHAWLWQIVAWALHAIAGLDGLAALKLGCAAIVGIAAFSALERRGWSLHAASLVVLACLAGMRFRLTDRPDTASLALLAIVAWILTSDGLSRARRAIAVFSVTAVWANVHAGALLAPALAAALSLGSLVEVARALRGRRPGSYAILDRARSEALAAAASLGGLLVNPSGYRLLLVPFELERSLRDPRLINPEWLPPRFGTFPFFHLALAGAIAACVYGILVRRDASLWRPLLAVAGSGALALGAARHVGVFFTLLPFALALARDRTPRSHPDPSSASGGERGRASGSWAPIWGLAASLLFPLVPSSLMSPPGFGVEPNRFPVTAADYVERNLETPRSLYNDVGHGGYLIWRFFPEDRVFIDGRNEVYPDLLKELASSLDDGQAWSRLLDRHGIESALVRFRDERIKVAGASAGEERSFTALHFPKTRWALVHWDDAAMVFVRRDEAHAPLIAKDEYRFIQPEDREYQIARCRAGDIPLLQGILADLDRRMKEPPAGERAERLRATFEALRAP